MSEAKRAAARRNQLCALEATLDWASEPCRRCGKHPLSLFNKTGYCRNCSRRHARGALYPPRSR